MHKSSTVWLIVTVLITLWMFFPKHKPNQYEVEIRALAFSYGIYNNSVCPNKKQMALLKHDYLRTIQQTNVTERQWVDKNFEAVFSKECSDLEDSRLGVA